MASDREFVEQRPGYVGDTGYLRLSFIATRCLAGADRSGRDSIGVESRSGAQWSQAIDQRYRACRGRRERVDVAPESDRADLRADRGPDGLSVPPRSRPQGFHRRLQRLRTER